MRSLVQNFPVAWLSNKLGSSHDGHYESTYQAKLTIARRLKLSVRLCIRLSNPLRTQACSKCETEPPSGE